MNSEIYYLYKNKSKRTANQESNDILSVLLERDINVLYKTSVGYDSRKILLTLKQSAADEKKIDVIFIFNGLGKTDTCPVIEAFEKISKKLENTDSEKKTKENTYAIYSLGEIGNGYKACFTVHNDITLVALPKSELSGLSDAEMAKIAVDRLNNTDLIEKTNKSVEFELFEYERKRVPKTSWKYYIPVKGDGLTEIARKVFFMIAAVAVLISAGVIINSKILEPASVQNTYDDLKNLYYNATDADHGPSDNDTKKSDGKDDVLDSFKTLIAINDEVQGWIYIPNTKNIDYPVLYCKSDNSSYQKYLYQDFNGNTSNYGSIFIDYRSNKGVDSKNVILHGHNSGNDLMFSEICKYKSLDFYQSAPTFTFTSRKETSEYVVFAVFITNTRSEHGVFFNYLMGSFNNDSEFMNYVYLCRARSLINTPVTVNENDTLMTLSTCSYEYKEFRTVVLARKVRPGEKENGFAFNTSNSYYNSNPVYPTIWYQDRGGIPPATSTFENAYSSGGISWYDGYGISGPSADPGIYYVNENPDYNDVASKVTSSKPPKEESSAPDQSETASSEPVQSDEPEQISDIESTQQQSDDPGVDTDVYNPDDDTGETQTESQEE